MRFILSFELGDRPSYVIMQRYIQHNGSTDALLTIYDYHNARRNFRLIDRIHGLVSRIVDSDNRTREN